MYDELVKRLRDAAKMSEALAVLLPYSEGSKTAELYKEAADAIEELRRERTGVWITPRKNYCKCSACGMGFHHSVGGKLDNYCGECGAKMK